MRDSKVVRVCAVLLILGACAAICLVKTGGFGPGIEPVLHRATGSVLAQQALGLLKPGGQVIVIARDTSVFKNPASDIQLAAFYKVLSKANATVGRSQLLQLDPLRPLRVPSGDFLELIKSSSKESVIVSFMGPPLLEDAERAQLTEVKPSIVAFCSGSLAQNVDLRSLFEQGLLKAAVVTRRNPAGQSSRPRDMRQCFDQSYLLITPENLAALSAVSIAVP